MGYNQVAGKHVLFAAASKSGLLVTRQGSTATSRPFSRRVPKLAVSVETQLLQLQEELDQAKVGGWLKLLYVHPGTCGWAEVRKITVRSGLVFGGAVYGTHCPVHGLAEGLGWM